MSIHQDIISRRNINQQNFFKVSNICSKFSSFPLLGLQSMHAVPLIFGFLAHFTIFLQSLFLASTFFALFVHFLFLARILLRSVVYAGSNHRLGLAGEFGQICAGIYQCAIQRGSAGMELGKVLEPQLNLTNSVRLKSDSSALPCHPCTILRATTYMPRIRHVVIINFL